jgi:hypothetical protein
MPVAKNFTLLGECKCQMTLIKCVVVCHELGQMATFKAKSETDYLFPTSN